MLPSWFTVHQYSGRRHLTFTNQVFGFFGGSVAKNLPASVEDVDSIPDPGSPLEKKMATHSSVLAWRIP